MVRWTIALTVGLALAGCRDEGVDALEATRVEVCQCQDAACVNAAMEKLQDRPTRNRHKAEGISRAIAECIAAVYRASDAATEPSEEPDEDENGAGDGAEPGAGSDLAPPAGTGSAAPAGRGTGGPR